VQQATKIDFAINLKAAKRSALPFRRRCFPKPTK
jgi:hypothetical protein